MGRIAVCSAGGYLGIASVELLQKRGLVHRADQQSAQGAETPNTVSVSGGQSNRSSHAPETPDTDESLCSVSMSRSMR